MSRPSEAGKHPFLAYLRKHWQPICVIAADVMIVPGILLCRVLSSLMLAQNNPCSWTLVGAQCGTCGGTRCVSNLARGNFAEAFSLNPFVFSCVVYLVITLVLLHFAWLFRKKFAERILRGMYSIPALIVAVSTFLLFTVLRNIPFITALIRVIAKRL